MKLVIVTICLSFPSSDFSLTLDSLITQTDHYFYFIPIISQISQDEAENLLNILKKQSFSHKLIANSDQSIYDAMNLGLLSAAGLPVLFLNAGDCFYSDSSVSLIKKFYIPGKVNAFSVINKFNEKTGFLRLSNPIRYHNSISYFCKSLILFKSSPLKLPPHQGLISSYVDNDNNEIYFDQHLGFYADSNMTKRLILTQGVVYFDHPIAFFSLDGVSSIPSRKRMIAYMKRRNFLKYLLEPIFIVLFNLSPLRYYQFVNFLSGNKCVNLSE